MLISDSVVNNATKNTSNISIINNFTNKKQFIWQLSINFKENMTKPEQSMRKKKTK